MSTILSTSYNFFAFQCTPLSYKGQKRVLSVIQTDGINTRKYKLPPSTSFPHYLIQPPLVFYFTKCLTLYFLVSDQTTLSKVSSPLLPLLPSLPLLLVDRWFFGLIVKCVELNECAWKKIGRRRGDSPNLFVEMEYGKEKARTETIRNTLSPVFPAKQIIVTPWA